jgi:uncharacterized membrane protein YqaE (UPF0057 family)
MKKEKKSKKKVWIAIGIIFFVLLVLLTIGLGTSGVWIALLIALYFLPTMQAYYNDKKQLSAIGTLNLLLGWTILGWIFCIVWACMKE